ncbi:NAD(P)/FAD-dependent oxidoreductase [Niveispirillum sp. BGYR6]|uniref:NAD(P)/FAD-dependent oxidoreductase n=1 Tax=Niveispirillum sp. BGYR6 TaxID=2971249 RepID=UPI0022B94773|nr:NAD(P)/FAD-dependent oxidoreductase [Niveispirillum sp. BGYR6]
MDQIGCVVIGGGVVGLAVARALAMAGREVLILEAEKHFGQGISSRNSEVIHAGLYYPSGSVRAELCVDGRDRLYRYCLERGIGHRRLGKLVVATDAAQESKLRDLLAQGKANGVDDLCLLDDADVRELEPALRCVAGLLSPSTGIVDSHALMVSLLGDAEDHGAILVRETPVLAVDWTGGGFTVRTGGREPTTIRCRELINAAGLDAWSVAQSLSGYDPADIPPRHYAKGNYYALQGVSPPFNRLIYPIPEDGGLGVHLTLDLAGQGRFGPDVEWLAPGPLDYQVDPRRADAFYQRIRLYWPGLPDGVLVPAYCGIRPKLSGPGEKQADFLIQTEAEHRLPGLVHLFGIESPGLTSSLAIAQRVVDILRP